MKTKIISEDNKIKIKLTTETKLEKAVLSAISIPASKLMINLVHEDDKNDYLLIDIIEEKIETIKSNFITNEEIKVKKI